MKIQYLITLILVVICIAGLWMTQPPVEEPTEQTIQKAKPEEFPVAKELQADGFTIGSATDDQIQVRWEGEKIRVELRPEVVSAFGDLSLSKWGMIDRVEYMSDERYREFLDLLHMSVEDHHH